MKRTSTNLLFTLIFSCALVAAHATNFTSTQSGDWDDASTWGGSGTPSKSDDITIAEGHTVTLSSSNKYQFQGTLTIESGAKFIAATGSDSEGFTLNNAVMHVYGEFEIPFENGNNPKGRTFTTKGQAEFWAHPGSYVSISNDFVMKGQSEVIADGICILVNDDFEMQGGNTYLCGNGGVTIGTDTNKNVFSFKSNANKNQVCADTKFCRGTDQNCSNNIVEDFGTGNRLPVPVNDKGSTNKNVSIFLNVLSEGTPDTDPDGDAIELWGAGEDGRNGKSKNGGIISMMNNGTPDDLTDDYVMYVPPVGFVGQDEFSYMISDGNGGISYGLVEMDIQSPLPVTLEEFTGNVYDCRILLLWTTSNEENNDYFEVERSIDGVTFKSIARVEGSGTTDIENFYQHIDRLPERMNYYRLRQVDFDGTSHFSEVILLENDCLEKEYEYGIVSLFPNPVMTQDVIMRVNMAEEKEEGIVVTSMQGEIIYRSLVKMDAGLNVLELDVQDYPAGTYFVRIGQHTKKFTKIGN